MKKYMSLLLLMILPFMATACNMLHGAGEDVEEAGDNIKDATN